MQEEMWLGGGQTESFQNVTKGGEGIYDVLKRLGGQELT